MRFAYIDTRGNEVTIPSVDALRLRIELGAIQDDTQFHDANTGKWAPAEEHEIFRTLKRELEELEAGGFAPPPPGIEDAPPAAPPSTPAPEAATPPEAAVAPEVPAAPDVEPPAVPDGAPAADDFGLGVDLGLAPAGGEAVEDPTPAASAGGETGGAETGGDDVLAGLGGIELSGEWDASADEAEAPTANADPDPLGGLGDLGDSALGGTGDGDGPPQRFAMSPQDDLAASVPEPGLTGNDIMGDPDDLSGLALDPAAADHLEDEPPAIVAEGTGLDLEQPLSDYDADQPPAWTQAGGDGLGGGFDDPAPPGDEGFQPGSGYDAATGGDFGADTDMGAGVADDAGARGGYGGDSASTDAGDEWGGSEEDRSRGEPPARPTSRPRGAPPQRKLTRASTPGAGRVLGLILAVVVLGGGGWYGYQNFFSGRIGGEVEDVSPLPEIPATLVPQMRQLADRAVSAAVEQLSTLPDRERIAPRPDPDWLSGSYLAGATGYPGVPEYWDAVAAYQGAVEREADQAFADALETEIEASNLTATNADLIRERAIAGWNAAAGDRGLVLDQLRGVAISALELHDFLVLNEDQIAYEPAAAGLSRDPVLEAVPATEELGTVMWDRVGAITAALDALGYLDTITTDGLLQAFLENLEATPIR